MKIIYQCYGGSHSSVLAAAIHLQLVNIKIFPSYDELFALPYFDKTDDDDFGSIRKMGLDEWGNEVYVLGKKDFTTSYSKTLYGLACLLGVENQFLTIDVIDEVNWLMKIGGYTSRKLNLVKVGRFFLYYGTKKSFHKLVRVVENIKIQLGKINNENITYRK
ncbi:MAG: DUF3189 family protein [Syntrophomonadaceae bacterium]|nr:DUF3189 family protein [Syntrophomonadaceae bacterium]